MEKNRLEQLMCITKSSYLELHLNVTLDSSPTISMTDFPDSSSSQRILTSGPATVQSMECKLGVWRSLLLVGKREMISTELILQRKMKNSCSLPRMRIVLS